jgi:hypothetical protein
LKRFFSTKLRQIWIPKEFRLPEPEFTKEQLDLIEELIQTAGSKFSRAAGAARNDEISVPAHDAETAAVAPSLRELSPAEEKTDARTPVSDEEMPGAPAMPEAEDAAPREMPESLRKERESDVKPNAETTGEPMPDTETASAAETEEGQNTAAPAENTDVTPKEGA